SLAMSDPKPAVADPASELPALAEAYPTRFDGERPRPLKLRIHKNLLATGCGAAGVEPAQIKRALGRYCNRPRYRKALREAPDVRMPDPKASEAPIPAPPYPKLSLKERGTTGAG
ncbi:MAG: hypothetical protein JNJ76_10600, partial [Candidatus Competibacter sp.]|nr:hypothetical protein [Candidatus Competibacter sp.]